MESTIYVEFYHDKKDRFFDALEYATGYRPTPATDKRGCATHSIRVIEDDMAFVTSYLDQSTLCAGWYVE